MDSAKEFGFIAGAAATGVLVLLVGISFFPDMIGFKQARDAF